MVKRAEAANRDEIVPRRDIRDIVTILHRSAGAGRDPFRRGGP
jgi:hypothetical protein